MRLSITVAAIKSTFPSQEICLKYQQKKVLMSVIKHLTKLLQEYHADLIDIDKAIEMTTILNRFKEILSEKVEEAENYRSEKSKRRLMNHYGNGITFQK